jgi:hypothetical protein
VQGPEFQSREREREREKQKKEKKMIETHTHTKEGNETILPSPELFGNEVRTGIEVFGAAL